MTPESPRAFFATNITEIAFITLLPLLCIDGYRILGVFPTRTQSHHICGSALMRGLAAAGHNVTVVSAFPLAKPLANYRDIVLHGMLEQQNQLMPASLLESNGKSPLVIPWLRTAKGEIITNLTLTHPAFRALLADPSERFDVIVMEVFLNEAMLGLGHHFNAPIVGYSSFGASTWTNDMVGTPTPLSYIPNTMLGLANHMTFTQRLVNTLLTANENIAFSRHLAVQTRLYEQLFPGTDKPPLDGLRRNVSLVLLNTHFTLSSPRPYVPNMIEIGGAHIDRSTNGQQTIEQLPAELRRFMNGAEHGVIYFSLGSAVKAVDLPVAKRVALLRAFGRLKQRVLWKWEMPMLPGKPDNVLIGAWFPQDALLAHPKVRLFVTHGGLLSTTEAVYHGVPLVGIPVFADQGVNMARAEVAGFARTVQFGNLTEESMLWAVTEVLGDERYAKAVATASRRYRDQPMTPMATGVFWVEYVARHGGAPHMRSAGQHLSALEYHNVDVLALLLLAAVVLVVVALWLLTICLRRCFCRGRAEKVDENADKKQK